MYRTLLCLLMVSFAGFSPVFGQKSKPKTEKSWQELIIGSWKLDSTLSVQDGDPHRSDEKLFKDIYLQVYKDGRVAVKVVWDEHRSFFAISTYELLEGKNKRVVEVDERMPIAISIDKVTGSQMVVRAGEPGRKGLKEYLFYMHHADFPDEFLDNLAGQYVIGRSVEGGVVDNEKSDVALVLMQDGKMKYEFGTRKDSGTWSVDPKSFALVLNGTKGKKRMEIRKWAMKKLELHPADAPKDSVIRLMEDYRMVEERHEVIPDVPMEEHVTAADTIVTMDESLNKNWKAILEGSLENEERRDSVNADIYLNLKSDKTFTYTLGRKTVKGVWSQPNNGTTLILKTKKQEQIANFTNTFIMEGTEEESRYLPVLDLTFTDPIKGTVRKMLFKAVE